MHLWLSFFELSHNQIYFFSTLFLSYLPSSTCFLSLAFLCIVLLFSLHAQMDGSRSLTRGSTLVNRVSFLCPSLCFSLLLLSPQWTPQWFWLTQQSNLKPLNCGSSYCLLLLLSYLSFLFVYPIHMFIHPFSSALKLHFSLQFVRVYNMWVWKYLDNFGFIDWGLLDLNCRCETFHIEHWLVLIWFS